jgi:site-specific recombinase XerC
LLWLRFSCVEKHTQTRKKSIKTFGINTRKCVSLQSNQKQRKTMTTTIEIGQKGKLGNEVLTVVSISGTTFKCDNGKTYMIKNAFWMTNPVEEIKAPKAAKKAVRDLTEDEKERLAYLKHTGNDLDSALKASTIRYRNGKSGFISLTK